MLARVAGLRVGRDTEGRAERLFGPGKRETGQHSRGALAWRLPGRAGYLRVDGWDYTSAGYYVNEFHVSTNDCGGGDATLAPVTRIPARSFPVLGSIRPGVSAAEVASAMRRHGLRPYWDYKGLCCTVFGHSTVPAGHHEGAYRRWELSVGFAAGRANAICVSCE